MTLTALPGGGELATVMASCGICGAASHHPCGVLAAHLGWLRLRGLELALLAGTGTP